MFVLLLLPLAAATVSLIGQGGYASQRILWQSSPAGIDLVTMVEGPPRHLIVGELVGMFYRTARINSIEQSGWISLVGLFGIGAALLRYRDQPDVRAWLVLAAAFFAVAIGPFVRIDGVDTGIPGPFALLRYVPPFSNARMPGRAIVVVQLAAAVLTATPAAEARRVRAAEAAEAALSRFLFALTTAIAAAVAFVFLLLPIVAIFLRIPVRELFAQLDNQVARDALVVSLKTSAIAHISVLVFGTPTAYLLARKRFPGRSAVMTLIELPLVLPPAVAGIALLAAFGRLGLLGDQLDALGIQIGFTQTAVVLAVAFVESPFYLRGAIASFEGVDENLISAARTLGAGPWRVFGRIALPLAAGGLGAASALALARGLGEFGATLIFAGSLQGVTQTLPLAIYAQLDQDFDVALAISALFILAGAAILIGLKVFTWTRLGSISRFRLVTSTSK